MDDTRAPATGGRHRATTDPTPATSPGAAQPDGTAVERCPSCSSRVGPRELWCSLCHAALRTTSAPLAPVTGRSDELPIAPPTTQESELQEPELQPELDEAAVEAMLAELARSGSAPALRGLSSTRAKVVVAAGGGVGLTGLLLLAMTVLGAIRG